GSRRGTRVRLRGGGACGARSFEVLADLFDKVVESRLAPHRSCPRSREGDPDLAKHAGRPPTDDDHAIGEEHGLLDVVGDVDDRARTAFPEAQQLVTEVVTSQLIEGRQGLVHEQDLGVDDERARQCDPLAHAARELVRVGVGRVGQAHPRDPFVRRDVTVRTRAPVHLQRQRHVLAHRSPGVKTRVLRDEADALPPPGHGRRDAKQGAQVMCLQDLSYGPYFYQVQDTKHDSYTEKIPDGPTTKLMQELAKKHSMVLILPMYEEDQVGVYYNTAAVIDAHGKYLGKYRKTHIPHVNGFWEKFYFRPGNMGYPVF